MDILCCSCFTGLCTELGGLFRLTVGNSCTGSTWGVPNWLGWVSDGFIVSRGSSVKAAGDPTHLAAAGCSSCTGERATPLHQAGESATHLHPHLVQFEHPATTRWVGSPAAFTDDPRDTMKPSETHPSQFRTPQVLPVHELPTVSRNNPQVLCKDPRNSGSRKCPQKLHGVNISNKNQQPQMVDSSPPSCFQTM